MYPVLELKFPYVITKGRQQIRQNCEGSSPFRFRPFFVTLFFGVSSVSEFMPSSSIPPLEQFTVCKKRIDKNPSYKSSLFTSIKYTPILTCGSCRKMVHVSFCEVGGTINQIGERRQIERDQKLLRSLFLFPFTQSAPAVLAARFALRSRAILLSRSTLGKERDCSQSNWHSPGTTVFMYLKLMYGFFGVETLLGI